MLEVPLTSTAPPTIGMHIVKGVAYVERYGDKYDPGIAEPRALIAAMRHTLDDDDDDVAARALLDLVEKA